MERHIFNPFTAEKKLTAVAASAPEQEVATASALTNVDPSQCPKCPDKMSTAYLFDRRAVYYCKACRVTHPKE